MIKTLFLGSNWQAVKILDTLKNDNRFEIVGCITQPDKPVGRKQEMTPTEVKQYCLDNNIKVFHTENSVEKYQEALNIFKPELIVCIAFGEIIPGFFLEYPKYKSMNIHFSLLPKYRGAVPIQMAILNGEKETGITIMKMSEKFDKGAIIKMYKEEIREDDTNLSLRERLVDLSCKVLPADLIDWCEGKIFEQEQNEQEATYCYQRDISKEKAQIDFDLFSAKEIDRRIRAFIPWPLAWFMYKGKRIIIHEARLVSATKVNKGELLKYQGKLLLGTKDENTQIELIKLQMEGKKEVTGKEFQIPS